MLILFLSLINFTFAQNLTGEINIEERYFFEPGGYQNSNQLAHVIRIKPQYAKSWDNDRKSVDFKPYLLVSEPDQDKTHFDIREASYLANYDTWEIRVGVSKVFWGVSESQHIVDVINQTDLVENIDGEQKLGQPMIIPTLITSVGNFSAFILPYFRERTFAGLEGRLRPSVVIKTDDPIYINTNKAAHVDYAFRWSHSLNNWDLGLSYFKGTDREPFFTFDGTNFIPNYGQAEQLSLDTQYLWNDFIFKLELLSKNRPSYKGQYTALTTGLEYTLNDKLSLIYEYLYDDRSDLTTSILGWNNHSFVAFRLSMNDTASTEFLGGFYIENSDGDVNLFRLEGSRRLSDNFKAELQTNILIDANDNTILVQARQDSYAQMSLSYFW
ncbi:MAG: hypothetical protein JNM93_14170 [Bacteriovoracaceae bacterium]|nr:hypothetical protein [Bacteriovoracaceae bacterium]